MFADKIDILRHAVVVREREHRQKKLNDRRRAVMKDVMRDAKDSFLDAMKSAIASSYTDYGHQVVLRTYSIAEMEKPDEDDITLLEVIRETDVLDRVVNCLAPGFFRYAVIRKPCLPQRPGEKYVFEIKVRFHAYGFEPIKPPCTCVCSYLTDGFCDVCGGHNVRDLNRYPRKDNWREGDDWICASCNHLHEQPLTHCFNCKKPRQERQINNPEDEEHEPEEE